MWYRTDTRTRMGNGRVVTRAHGHTRKAHAGNAVGLLHNVCTHHVELGTAHADRLTNTNKTNHSRMPTIAATEQTRQLFNNMWG